MDDAQVAVAAYCPDWWPAATRLLILRVRLDPAQVSADPRSRRRRTLHPGQRALPIPDLAGAEAIYGYSFILTNLDVSAPGKAAAVEHWYRHRTTVENIFRDSKHGAALRHLPSGYPALEPTRWRPRGDRQVDRRGQGIAAGRRGRTAPRHPGHGSPHPPADPGGHRGVRGHRPGSVPRRPGRHSHGIPQARPAAHLPSSEKARASDSNSKARKYKQMISVRGGSAPISQCVLTGEFALCGAR
jgi:hypothetical protein